MTDANGRATILAPGDKINGGEHTLEDLMARIESLLANKRLLRQIGVRESLQRVRDETGVKSTPPLPPLRSHRRLCLLCARSASAPRPATWLSTR